MSGYESVSRVAVAAPPADVFQTLTDSESFGRAMFGTTVETDWRVGSPIVYRGEFEGAAFEDHGEVLEVTPPSLLRISHSSAGSAVHELRFDIDDDGDGSIVTLTQDNNDSEEAAEHSRKNWDTMLGLLKQVVED